jgi:hypothetical protein
MYHELTRLDPALHKDLRIAHAQNYSFARSLTSCALTAREFSQAARQYPIVFSESDGDLLPVAVLGTDENLFVDRHGAWKKDAYIPSDIRRYPFAIASALPEKNSAVFMDASYEGFYTGRGERLFTDSGKYTAYMKRTVEFLRLHNEGVEEAVSFARYLRDIKLLKPLNAPLPVPNPLIVDESLITGVPEHYIVSLFMRGCMTWVYSHLYSLENLLGDIFASVQLSGEMQREMEIERRR